jgi:APA family basic amino acid/polyamine antiporter
LESLNVKKLSFWQTTAIGLGNIVGAGIFVMAGSAISETGPSAILAFMITSALAVTVGLNSAELASKMPELEGGVYSFARSTLGDTVGFLVGWFRIISYAISGAAVALGFAGYFVSVGLSNSFTLPIAILLILGLSALEVKGLRIASTAEEILVVVNIIGLAVFIGAVFTLGKVTEASFTPLFPFGAAGVLTAANIAFFAYSGFNTITTLTPDVEKGEKTVPRSIIFSLIISTVLYLLVVTSMLVAMNWSNYGTTANPLSLALTSLRVPPIVSLIVAFSALTATLTVTLSLIIAGSRTTKQMGKDGLLPKTFGKGSLIPTAIVSVVMVASLGLGNVRSIALIANFGVVFSYLLSGLEVVVTRRREQAGKFYSPGYPWVQIFSVALSLILLLSLGNLSLIAGVAALVIGLVVHLVQTELKKNNTQPVRANVTT